MRLVTPMRNEVTWRRERRGRWTARLNGLTHSIWREASGTWRTDADNFPNLPYGYRTRLAAAEASCRQAGIDDPVQRFADGPDEGSAT